MGRLRRSAVWIRRWKHTRGFGVQSPWAYRFIRYVINEHYPYYSYEDLRLRWFRIDVLSRKMAELLFRIANDRQARHWYFYGEVPACWEDYVRTACSHADVTVIDEQWTPYIGELEKDFHGNVVVIDADEAGKTVYDRYASRAHEGSLLIVLDIHDNKQALRRWRNMRDDKRSGITFDLYYCGLIFFDHRLIKQDYIVNF